jgi:hypothetical protein
VLVYFWAAVLVAQALYHCYLHPRREVEVDVWWEACVRPGPR